MKRNGLWNVHKKSQEPDGCISGISYPISFKFYATIKVAIAENVFSATMASGIPGLNEIQGLDLETMKP